MDQAEETLKGSPYYIQEGEDKDRIADPEKAEELAYKEDILRDTEKAGAREAMVGTPEQKRNRELMDLVKQKYPDAFTEVFEGDERFLLAGSESTQSSLLFSEAGPITIFHGGLLRGEDFRLGEISKIVAADPNFGKDNFGIEYPDENTIIKPGIENPFTHRRCPILKNDLQEVFRQREIRQFLQEQQRRGESLRKERETPLPSAEEIAKQL